MGTYQSRSDLQTQKIRRLNRWIMGVQVLASLFLCGFLLYIFLTLN